MKSRIIKTYSSWLNEAVAQPAVAQGQPAQDGIAFIGVSCSASNLADASKFGFKKDIVYSITLPYLGQLKYLDDDGSKFGGPAATSKITINLDSTEKVAKPGDDILEINGKKIYEAGTIIMKKTDISGPLTIKASNNGLLALIRFGNALADMATRFKFGIGSCKNYTAKFTLGKAVAEADARGFTYYWAKPGTLGPSSNGLVSAVAIATLELLGLKDHIALTDQVFGSYYQWVAGKDAATASPIIADKIAKFVKTNRMIINEPVPNTSAALATITKASMNSLVQYDQRASKFRLTPEGIKRIKSAVDTIAAAITPTKPPVEFSDSADVFAGYSDIIKTGLMVKSNDADIASWFDKVQAKQTWSPAGQLPGGSDRVKASQGEGQVGR